MLYAVARHPLPDLAAGELLARLPVEAGEDGPLFDRQSPCDHNDRVFADWDAPLVWHHQKSQVKCSTKFRGQRAVHMAFEDRVPADVWDRNWTLWYDHALLYRAPLPSDLLLTGTFALEEVSTGLGADNMELVRPWAGMVARMQDLRRYYFLTLEFPDRVVLYRRDDHQWTELAGAQVHFNAFDAHRLTLVCRGSQLRAWINDSYLFDAVDYHYAAGGWCGLRATCVAFCTDFAARRLVGPTAEPRLSSQQPATDALPSPRIARELDLAHLGPLSKSPRHHADMTLARLWPGTAEPQLVLKCFGHPEGATHAAIDLHGNTPWTACCPGRDRVHLLPPGPDGACDLIIVGRQMHVVSGRTGQILRTAPLPAAPDGVKIRPGNGPEFQADLDGDGVVDTFFLTCGANSPHLWAVDHSLVVRWFLMTPSGQGHGRHLAVIDADGDGRDEIAAGCCLIDAAGKIRWAQDEVIRRLGCLNGGHVDCTQAGWFDGPEGIPTIHFQGSSAGHVVLDARDGTLLAVHPQGHSQCGLAGRVVPGTDGVQVIASNRWGSYGVTAVYDAVGNRLSRFQAGFTSQMAAPINWSGRRAEHLLVCDGQGYRGLYDHCGVRLIDLEPFIPYTQDPFTQRYDRVNTLHTPMLGGPCDDLLIRCGSRLRIVTAERRFASGTRVYAPVRRGNASLPGYRTLP